MNDSRVSEIKKEDKKAFKGFLCILIVSGIAGAVFSQVSGNLKEVLGENLANFLMNILEQITPYVSFVISIVMIIVSKIIYTKSRKGYELWKQRGQDDDSIDKIEENLSYLLIATSVNNIFAFFFMGAGIKLFVAGNMISDNNNIKVLWLLVGFILCVSSSILIQKKVVNLEKEINPLLKGSVYDSKFGQKWLNSCDESIRLSIYKSSYKSYIATSTTCTILWLFCIVGFILWDFGITPLVMVTIIWLVLTISYSLESIKQSKIK